ncbi:MAG: hypothetical protein J5781_04265 [Clostridia bacterium]|nr:hypothetical protein [Clostridia bacterium]
MTEKSFFKETANNKILDFVRTLGFSKIAENAYRKQYGDYGITIEYDGRFPEKTKIDYGNRILCHSKTVSLCFQPETFVVLECVNRLLEKGYKPENIELGMLQGKKSWDILVKEGQEDNAVAIECLAWPLAFHKKHKEKSVQRYQKTEELCFYTSQISDGKIEFFTNTRLFEDDKKILIPAGK